MSAANWQNLPHRDHPLLKRFLIAVFVVTLGLGFIHECRIAGEVVIVLVRHGKHELAALGDVAERLKRELTTWKEDP